MVEDLTLIQDFTELVFSVSVSLQRATPRDFTYGLDELSTDIPQRHHLYTPA
jgi:hypothetical protein